MTIDDYNAPCPKCAQGRMVGPRYQFAPEALLYVCSVCGYRETRPTADSTDKKKFYEWAWENMPTPYPPPIKYIEPIEYIYPLQYFATARDQGILFNGPDGTRIFNL